MALGVADAVRAAGTRGEVAVVGFDGIRQALAAVRRGALSATVSQYPYSLGQLGIEACLAAVSGESVPSEVDAPVQVDHEGERRAGTGQVPATGRAVRKPVRRPLRGVNT